MENEGSGPHLGERIGVLFQIIPQNEYNGAANGLLWPVRNDVCLDPDPLFAVFCDQAQAIVLMENDLSLRIRTVRKLRLYVYYRNVGATLEFSVELPDFFLWNHSRGASTDKE
jgi:hypothetical protein